MGGSGSGKTTLMRLIACGQIRPQSGQVLIKERGFGFGGLFSADEIV